jgi:hypothetical protein
LDAPDRFDARHGDVRDLLDPLEKRPEMGGVKPKAPSQPQLMYVKPTFDNVPAY